MKNLDQKIFLALSLFLTCLLPAGCTVQEQAQRWQTAVPVQTATPSLTKQNWRTQREYSQDFVFSNEMTFCFSLLEDASGVGVYNAKNGKKIGELPFPEEYIGVSLAKEDPYKLTDVSGEGNPEIYLTMADGCGLIYCYEPDMESKDPFIFFGIDMRQSALSVIEASNDPAVSSTVSFPYEYTAQNQMTQAPKELYEKIKTAVFDLKPFRYDAATYGYDTLDNILLIWAALSQDYPDVDNYFTVGEELDGTTTTALHAAYSCVWNEDEGQEKEKIHAGLERYDQVCDGILAKLPEESSTLMKYYILAKELCDRAEYDYRMSAPGIATPYGALVNGSAICQGYAKAYQALCQKAGLYCTVVGGSAGNDSHAWNLVRLESGTYHVDLTWADETDPSQGAKWLKYFMRTQEEILEDHNIDDGTQATGTPLGLY